MVHRFGGGFGVVDVDARHAEPRIELAAVDDRRAPRRDRVGEGRRFLRQPVTEKDQAVGFLAPQHQRVPLLAGLLVLRVADEHGIALALRRVFDALQDQREKRIGDVRHGDEELRGPQRAQILRGRVRRVAERLDRPQHFAAGVGRHDVGLAQHARHGCGRDAGALRDFVDVGHGRRHHTQDKCRRSEVPCCVDCTALLASATDYTAQR